MANARSKISWEQLLFCSSTLTIEGVKSLLFPIRGKARICNHLCVVIFRWCYVVIGSYTFSSLRNLYLIMFFVLFCFLFVFCFFNMSNCKSVIWSKFAYWNKWRSFLAIIQRQVVMKSGFGFLDVTNYKIVVFNRNFRKFHVNIEYNRLSRSSIFAEIWKFRQWI